MKKKKKPNPSQMVKVANTSFLTENPYFQQKMKVYRILLKILKGTCILSILLTLFLASRPAKISTVHPEEYNRDIMLCMDVSGSVYDLDYEITGSLKELVSSLKGERIGISIFDASTVTVLPLTDDYDYVSETLGNLQRGFDSDFDINSSKEDLYYMFYAFLGTEEGNGSSLIGDGLSSCTFQFSNLEEDRTRIIILSTDNALAGDPLVTLEEAAYIAKKYGVIVYGIETDNISEKNHEDLKKAVEITGGKLYDSAVFSTRNIVDDINETSKSLYKGTIQTVQTDIPTIPFILLLVSTTLFIIIRRKVFV